MTKEPTGRADGPKGRPHAAPEPEPSLAIERHATPGGGSAAQIRKPKPHGFTPEKQEAFFTHLSKTANNTASARHAGICTETARIWRRTNADFRARWERALADGHADLEMRLLGVALFGASSTTTTTTTKGGKRTVKRTGDRPEIMIKVAKMNADSAEAARLREAEAQRIADMPPISRLWALVDRMRERAAVLMDAQQDEGEGHGAQGGGNDA